MDELPSTQGENEAAPAGGIISADEAEKWAQAYMARVAEHTDVEPGDRPVVWAVDVEEAQLRTARICWKRHGPEAVRWPGGRPRACLTGDHDVLIVCRR